ncbi:MAG: DNA alkylation response protein [Actinobacteria bacterium]|nr:DNA alkylation response protein [Actinomycetota bacterium]
MLNGVAPLHAEAINTVNATAAARNMRRTLVTKRGSGSLVTMLPDYATHDGAIGLDWYAADPNLRLLLDRLLTDTADREFAEEHVARYGVLCGGALARRAEVSDKHGPELLRYDEWGHEVDHIEHHPGWVESKADLVRAGFTGLSRHAGRPVPAVVTAAMNYLVSQAETAIYCGLGMTVGAADIVERYAPDDVRDDFVRRLTSLDPEEAWEGGMFLTERQGGSDVGANTTRAVPDGDEWRIFGEKHFCSNADAEVFIVLARPEGAPDGTRGLATFIVPRVLPDGTPNGFHTKRLKPKLGTKAVPTAEIELVGARAWMASQRASDREPGTPARSEGANRGGLNKMMEMVNGSRFGVALMGLGIHRRSFLEAAIYASHRTQWDQRIDAYPMVRETLVDLLVGLEAGMALTFECAAATRTTADEEEGRMLRRILVPIAKVRATREALRAASESLEIHGGNGYMEDWPMARQLRDAQCHTIWEGTENICCLDVRRAIRGEDAHEALLARVSRALDGASHEPVLAPAVDAVASTLTDAKEAIAHYAAADDDTQLLNAKRLTHLLADLVEGALLLDEATWQLGRDGDARKAVIARRFAQRLTPTRARGLLGDDRTVLDHFEPIVRYGPIEPAAA